MKLTKITNLDPQRKTVEVESGVILDDLNEYLEKYDLELPVNPSSHAVCTVGGMASTNAVGSRAGKYGKTIDWINWIEIVNSAGELERKNKFELTDYCGMEGITGVIYKIGFRVEFKKPIRTAALFSFDQINDVANFARELRRNENVSMIEFLDKQISEWMKLQFKYHLIIEYESDEGKIKNDEYEKLIALRDSAYPLLAEKGFYRIEDPKVLLDRFEKLFTYIESYNIPVFGHLSVGILHPCFSKDQEKLIPEIMNLTKRLSGQITGEHGIGLLKKEFVDANDKKLLINVKRRTDSLNKFNSGKVI
jgi:glycolate oxidase